MTSTQIDNDKGTHIRIGDCVSIILRGKRGTYCADFQSNGRHIRRSLKTANMKIARQRAIKLEADLAGGEYTAPAKPVLVADAKQQFIAAMKAADRAKKTIIAYDSECEVFVEFHHSKGVRMLTQITPQHFLAYRAYRKTHLAQKTLYTRLIIIKTFLNWCCGGGALLDKNPFRQCKVARPYISPKFSPTLDQVNSILAKATNPRLAQFAALAFTGLRVGELSMLRPGDVDLTGGWIRVVGREGWKPKTREARKVPIHPRLQQILHQYAASLTNIAARAYFFSDQVDGNNPINVRTVNVALQALAKSLSVPVSRNKNGLVVHSLRHYFETQCVDSGVPQFIVDQWMGHRGNVLMGATYYGHSDEKSVQFMTQVKF
jgi:integrase